MMKRDRRRPPSDLAQGVPINNTQGRQISDLGSENPMNIQHRQAFLIGHLIYRVEIDFHGNSNMQGAESAGLVQMAPRVADWPKWPAIVDCYIRKSI